MYKYRIHFTYLALAGTEPRLPPHQLTGLPRGLNTNSPSLQLDTTTTPLSKNG